MYYPGSACRGTDMPPGRILYIYTVHTQTLYIEKNFTTSYRQTDRPRSIERSVYHSAVIMRELLRVNGFVC